MRATPPRSPLRVTLIGGLATVVGVLPVFLTGAMAVQITDDLRFGTAALGVAVAAFRASAAVSSTFLGRLTDRIGAVSSLRLSALVSVVSSVGIATTTVSWAALVVWLMLAATANSLAQPAANRLLVRTVPAERQGVAFGVKQSAPPTASMLAGVSVPVIALTLGWQWAYLLGAALALIVLVGAGRRPPRDERGSGAATRTPLRDRSTLVLLAAALGLSTTASTTVPAFFVDASVRAGGSPELAGTLLAAASGAAILTRLVSGVIADRMPGGHLRLSAGMVAVGSSGLALLAVGTESAMAAGVVVALMGTWGFNGVFVFAVMRAYPDAPGSATGATMPGALIGGIVGPVAFGAVAQTVGYTLAWLLALAAALAAAAGFLVGARRLARRRVAVDPGQDASSG